MGLPDCGTYPTCTPCREAAAQMRDHDGCKGCIGCGCAMSAQFAHWISDPANRAT